jgi:hypothetical protein
MDALTIALIIAGGAVLGIVVWILATLGRALVKVAETLAAAAVLFVALCLMIKALIWALRQVITHWRTSLTLVALLAWWHWYGLTSLVLIVGVITTVFTLWRLVDLPSFDAWAGSASAGLVAALDDLRSETPSVVTRLRPEHHTRHHARQGGDRSPRAPYPAGSAADLGSAPDGARGALRCVLG